MLFADLQCWFTVKPEKKRKKNNPKITIFSLNLFAYFFENNNVYIITHDALKQKMLVRASMVNYWKAHKPVRFVTQQGKHRTNNLGSKSPNPHDPHI